MIAVVTCHFNWCRFNRPTQNLVRFIRMMERDGVPVFGMEAQLPLRPFVTTGRSGWKQVKANSLNIMFQKEQMINEVVRTIPPEFDKIAWVDADLMFSNPNWLRDTDTALDFVPFIQPFERAIWTGVTGFATRTRWSCGKVGLDNNWHGHPGFAWASRRDFFEISKLYTKAPCGSGDSIATNAFLGDAVFPSIARGIGSINAASKEFCDWRSSVDMYALTHSTGKRVGYIKGDVYHEWHGDLKNRGYGVERDTNMRDLDASKHLKVGDNGLLEWTASAPVDMIENIKSYFEGRREDG